MTIEEIIARQGEIEERKAQIDADLENPEADLDALNEEARKLAEESEQLTARLDELKAKAAEEEETRRKIAEGEICREDCGEYPVFLFDDVRSELDGRRRAYLLEQMSGKQVILTSCEQIADFKGKKMYVENGTVREI